MTAAGWKLALGEDLDLPAETAATQVYAWMGRRGSGKTYGAGRMAELLIGVGVQVVVIDPVGTWWGLRFAADGKKPSGLNVPVFGGAHGDLPLPPTAGKVFAEMVVTRSTSMVLDVSEMTGAEQRKFVGEFCLELFHAKKRSRSPLHIVFEEAQEFVPQLVRPEMAKMVGAVERLIKLGRNYGVGCSLISQRPQAVNKDVLNQAEVMLAFQLTGPQERKAITGWVQETGAGDREIANDLPSLKPGTALVWSPQWLGSFGRHKILRKETYDASATPTGGRAGETTRKLPPIDLDEVRAALASVETEIAANDVDALKAEVRKLKAAVGMARPPAPPPPPPIPPAVFARVESISETLGEVLDVMRRVVGEFELLQSDLKARRFPAQVSSTATVILKGPPPGSAARLGIVGGKSPQPNGASGKRLRAGVLRLVSILQQHHPARVAPADLAVLAVMTVTGGTFKAYIGELVGGCYVDREDGKLGLTPAGVALEVPRATLNRSEILDEWASKFRKGTVDILLELAVNHEATPQVLNDAVNRSRSKDGDEPMTITGGTWKAYVGELVGAGLFLRDGGKLRIHPELAQ
jgi:hypothetical protein